MLCFRAILLIYLYFVFLFPLEPPSLILCLKYVFYSTGASGSVCKILRLNESESEYVLFSEIVMIHVFICFIIYLITMLK